MTTITALLTSKAYGYPTRGARRRGKPTILACLHQTAKPGSCPARCTRGQDVQLLPRGLHNGGSLGVAGDGVEHRQCAIPGDSQVLLISLESQRSSQHLSMSGVADAAEPPVTEVTRGTAPDGPARAVPRPHETGHEQRGSVPTRPREPQDRPPLAARSVGHDPDRRDPDIPCHHPCSRPGVGPLPLWPEPASVTANSTGFGHLTPPGSGTEL